LYFSVDAPLYVLIFSISAVASLLGFYASTLSAATFSVFLAGAASTDFLISSSTYSLAGTGTFAFGSSFTYAGYSAYFCFCYSLNSFHLSSRSGFCGNLLKC
jgi:hypothetical protein